MEYATGQHKICVSLNLLQPQTKETPPSSLQQSKRMLENSPGRTMNIIVPPLYRSKIALVSEIKIIKLGTIQSIFDLQVIIE